MCFDSHANTIKKVQFTTCFFEHWRQLVDLEILLLCGGKIAVWLLFEMKKIKIRWVVRLTITYTNGCTTTKLVIFSSTLNWGMNLDLHHQTLTTGPKNFHERRKLDIRKRIGFWLMVSWIWKFLLALNHLKAKEHHPSEFQFIMVSHFRADIKQTNRNKEKLFDILFL